MFNTPVILPMEATRERYDAFDAVCRRLSESTVGAIERGLRSYGIDESDVGRYRDVRTPGQPWNETHLCDESGAPVLSWRVDYEFDGGSMKSVVTFTDHRTPVA